MTTVYIANCEHYSEPLITEKINTAINNCQCKIDKDTKILIKPNFLKPSSPEKAIITHPVLLKALTKLLLDYGAKVEWGDSPGFGNIHKVLQKAGLNDFVHHTKIKISDFSKTKKTRTEGIIFKEFEIPLAILEADLVVNVPKLKTHQMMYLTMAVKNLYGCIYGFKKIQYHLTAGKDYKAFATLLVDIYEAIKPKLNILDAIIGMEGNGPSSGNPRKFGFIAASDDALSLDITITNLLGIKIEAVPYLKMAMKNNFLKEHLKKTKIVKDSNIIVSPPIQPPPSYDTDFSLPYFLSNFIKIFLLSYPNVSSACKGCGACKRHCPASAIDIQRQAVIDRKKCIRCFCCQELCDYQAINIKKKLL